MSVPTGKLGLPMSGPDRSASNPQPRPLPIASPARGLASKLGLAAFAGLALLLALGHSLVRAWVRFTCQGGKPHCQAVLDRAERGFAGWDLLVQILLVTLVVLFLARLVLGKPQQRRYYIPARNPGPPRTTGAQPRSPGVVSPGESASASEPGESAP